MNFRNFIPAVLAVLGIKAFSKVDERQVITAEEKQKLAAVGFHQKFIEDFEKSLNEPEPEAGEASAEDSSRRVAVLSAMLGQTTSQLTAVTAEVERLKADSSMNF